LQRIIVENFDLRPGMLIKNFDLKKPIYKNTASGGHFGRNEFAWEQIKDLSHEKKAKKE
jgi:S-adenosylmethionine synthetase